MPQQPLRQHHFFGFAATVLALSVPVGIAAVAAAAAHTVRAADDVTVRGCVERDAASRSPVFKLAEQPPGTKVYRLIAPKEIDVAAQVGHTVDATGTVNAPTGRAPELTLKSLTLVRESCSMPGAR